MRNLLLSTVAALAITVAAPAAFADSNVDADSGANTNTVNAVQSLTSKIKNTTADVTNVTDDGDIDQRTGDVDYSTNTFNAEGLYTLQNQTGLNNSGNTGLNIGVQVNSDPGQVGPGVEEDQNLELEGSTNQTFATQTATSKIKNGDVTISNDNETSDATTTGNTTARTGDVTYNPATFNASGVYTLQNQTGLNNSGNTLTNAAAQLNSGGQPYNVTLDNASTNSVKATQNGTSKVSDSDASVSNDVFEDGVLDNRSGDVDYGTSTFNAEGLYTLQNNTGMNTSNNAGLNLAVQTNDNDDSVSLEENSVNEVVATQTLAASITGSSATVDNNFEPNSYGNVTNRTGDVSYASDTFGASGVYTLSNNTGMNNAGNTATNVAAQLNGPVGF
jgi:hypothetical protein